MKGKAKVFWEGTVYALRCGNVELADGITTNSLQQQLLYFQLHLDLDLEDQMLLLLFPLL
jgi:hypothetical protein